MNKVFYTLICAIIAIGSYACSDDKNESDIAPSPNPEKQEISVGVEGVEKTLSFNAASNWTAYSTESWANVSPEKGSAGNGSVTVKVAENNSSESRTATVTVATVKYNQPICVLTVIQDGKDAPDEPVTPPEDPLKPEEEDHPMVGDMACNASELVAKINVGWNIGNTCEGTPTETSWGNPKVTPELITAVKAAGFNAIRIPCRWTPHADDDMLISEIWLERVKEIIDYCVKEDMYVILNSHHDQWYDRLPVGYDANDIKLKFARMWTQIARYYRDYDEHLIFAGCNEVVKLKADGSEDWGAPTSSNQNFLNDLMKIFVERVRATSGNNSVRCLMIQSWAANFDFVANSTFKMPQDRVADRLIYEYHQYTWTYSTEAAGADQNKYFWGEPYKEYTPWFSGGESELNWRCDEVKKKFIDNGIPVIMAEFGAVQHNKSGNNAVADESRAYYHKQVVSTAKARGIKCFYWDNGLFTTTDNENFGLFDRKDSNKVPARAQIALDGIMEGLK